MELLDLSQIEENRLMSLENVIRTGVKAFCAVGDALTEIRDSKLYRTTHGTFEAYCTDRWQISRQRAYQLIDQSSVSSALQEAGNLSNALDISARDTQAIKPHLSEVAEEIREKVASGADPVQTTYEVIEAKRAEIKAAPKEDEPEDVQPDPWKELEAADKIIRDQETLIKSLSSNDVAKEVAEWQMRFIQLEGRLAQAVTTSNEAQKQAQYYADNLKKIRQSLKVEKNQDILPRIQKLIAEARA